MKKFIALVFMMIVAVSLFASYIPRDVTWSWESGDEAVAYYRYQLDGTTPEGWIVVPSTNTSYTLLDADASRDYTLYLECSYDGYTWSDTASQTIEKAIKGDEPEASPIPLPAGLASMPVPEVKVFEQEAAPVEIVEEGLEDVQAVPTISTDDLDSSTVVLEEEGGFAFSLLLRGGLSFPAEKNMDFRQSYGLSFDFSSIGDVSRNLGFGLRLNADLDMYNTAGDEMLLENLKDLFTFNNANFFNLDYYSLVTRASLLATMDVKAGIFTLTLGLGGGGGVSLTSHTNPALIAMYPHSIKGADNLYGFYAEALLGTRFTFGSTFNLGLEASGRMPIKDLESFRSPYFDISTSLVFGFTF